MTIDDIDLEDTMPRKFGNEYDNHVVFTNLDIIKSFYDTLSYTTIGHVDSATLISKRGISSPSTYIYGSIAGTIESISVLLHNGRCNDAFALMRKYCDSIILDIYRQVLSKQVDDKFGETLSIEYIRDNKIKKWVDAEAQMFTEKDLNKSVYKEIIEQYPKLTDLFNLTDKDSLYRKLRDLCNDNMHYNNLYNMTANDCNIIRARKDFRRQFIDDINKALKFFFSIHFAFIYEGNPAAMVSSDYVDYLDMGEQPPIGSERWVAPSVQNAFDSIVKPFNTKVAEHIKSLDKLDLE
jgi:hypothetical protein